VLRDGVVTARYAAFKPNVSTASRSAAALIAQLVS
jgi:hypothetical protein